MAGQTCREMDKYMWFYIETYFFNFMKSSITCIILLINESVLEYSIGRTRKVFLRYLLVGTESRFEPGTSQIRNNNIIHSVAKLIRSVCFVLNVISTYKL
jgi:hypothetical protein